MIFNKTLSLIFTGFFFLLLSLLLSSVVVHFLPNMNIVFSGIIIIIFVYISRFFYNYLRNDEFYKNNKNKSSDMKGESYLTKGETDIKKIFIIFLIILMDVLLAISLYLIS